VFKPTESDRTINDVSRIVKPQSRTPPQQAAKQKKHNTIKLTKTQITQKLKKTTTTQKTQIQTLKAKIDTNKTGSILISPISLIEL
jgi:hypothetical protein